MHNLRGGGGGGQGANRVNYGELAKMRIPLDSNIAGTVTCQNQRGGILHHKGDKFGTAHRVKKIPLPAAL